MIYRLPKYLYVVVCADGTICGGSNAIAYVVRKEAKAVVQELGGNVVPKAPCGPHRIVRTKDDGKYIRIDVIGHREKT